MNVTQEIRLSIAKEFSDTPGPRKCEEGDFSGDKFLSDLLAPRFDQAKREGTTLNVDLDGTEGYATSFLEAAFGGLARKHSAAEVLAVLRFKSNDEPYLVEEITRYINEANRK